MKKLNLRNSILVSFLSIPFLAIIVIIVYAGYQFIAREFEIKDQLATTNAVNLIDKVDRNFYERYGDVQAFSAGKIAIGAFDSEDNRKVAVENMNTMTSIYVLYDYMMLVDTNGKVVAVNTSDKNSKPINTDFLLGQNFGNTDWFKVCKASSISNFTWYSDFQFDDISKKMYSQSGEGMGFASPIITKEGAFEGVWYNYANWNDITSKMRREAEFQLNESFPKSRIIITDINNSIISSNDANEVKANAKLTFENGKYMISSSKNMLEEDYIVGKTTSKGAYSYTGKGWSCYVLINKGDGIWAIIFANLKGIILLAILCCFVTFLISFNVSQGIANKIIKIKNTISELSLGKLQEVEVNGDDEIAESMKSVNILVESLKEKSAFAEKIGDGKLETEYKPSSDKDMLGLSLLNMRNSLAKVAEDDRKRVWTNEGLALFGDILRSREELQLLCDNIIHNLVKYVKANQGGVFIVNHSDQLQETTIDLMAAYAYERKKYLKKTLNPGESLIGQCYLEQDTILLTQIPKDYINISSGLGEATPTVLLIVPMKTTNTVEGIIEIASFNNFEKHEIEFIEKIAENMASTIATVRINERTKTLLQETQQQAEEMKSQEEEMRQNLEELSATQEEISRKETDYINKITELEMIIGNKIEA